MGFVLCDLRVVVPDFASHFGIVAIGGYIDAFNSVVEMELCFRIERLIEVDLVVASFLDGMRGIIAV